jgi:hypothetical protein
VRSDVLRAAIKCRNAVFCKAVVELNALPCMAAALAHDVTWLRPRCFSTRSSRSASVLPGPRWKSQAFQSSWLHKSLDPTVSTALHCIQIEIKEERFNPCLTQCSKVLFDKPIVAQLVQKHHAFYGTRRFITLFTRTSTRNDTQRDESSPNLEIFLSFIFISLILSSHYV